ncbi:MAG: acetyl-CoA carboxylase biotin carboxyl carrier protein [Acidobacteriota bacterium]|nr:acetyl-CoA carboxylase biotin carboxyl carrier protein [Acidobacteriota bacterium]
MKKIERKTKRATPGAAKASAPKTTPAKVAAGSEDNLSLAEIKTLIELISDKQFNEFELERGSLRLRLSKGVQKVTVSQVAAEPARIVEQAAVAVPSALPAQAPTAPVATPAPQEENLHIVTSPIVGTFYGAPSPTAKPFVAVGDAVEIGKVLCIVEAMKLMNEIQSDASGVIAKIFVESGQPVEYGQALFGIKK